MRPYLEAGAIEGETLQCLPHVHTSALSLVLHVCAKASLIQPLTQEDRLGMGRPPSKPIPSLRSRSCPLRTSTWNVRPRAQSLKEVDPQVQRLGEQVNPPPPLSSGPIGSVFYRFRGACSVGICTGWRGPLPTDNPCLLLLCGGGGGACGGSGARP